MQDTLCCLLQVQPLGRVRVPIASPGQCGLGSWLFQRSPDDSANATARQLIWHQVGHLKVFGKWCYVIVCPPRIPLRRHLSYSLGVTLCQVDHLSAIA